MTHFVEHCSGPRWLAVAPRQARAGPVSRVDTATNRIRIALNLSDTPEPLVLAFEMRRPPACGSAAGGLAGRPECRTNRRSATRMTGLYAHAGVGEVCTDGTMHAMPPVRWADWLATWQRDQDGKGHEPPLLPDVYCTRAQVIDTTPYHVGNKQFPFRPQLSPARSNPSTRLFKSSTLP